MLGENLVGKGLPLLTGGVTAAAWRDNQLLPFDLQFNFSINVPVQHFKDGLGQNNPFRVPDLGQLSYKTCHFSFLRRTAIAHNLVQHRYNTSSRASARLSLQSASRNCRKLQIRKFVAAYLIESAPRLFNTMIGTKLAHYEITKHLGSGGMGDVYQATDSKLGRSVAIKFLPEAFNHDPDRVARFEREARVLASLNHPNIAAICGFEQSADHNCLVMELVPGETLAERIRRGPMPVDEAFPIANQICDALEAAHEKGVVHRDLKPANVKVTPEGIVKVLDFGLAKTFEVEPSNASLSQSPTLSMGATNAGVILATAAYMSPEQAKGRMVDKRTDIFALGALLYEMLTGRPAFAGDDVGEILVRVIEREPDWSKLPSKLPWRIPELLRRCLEKDPRKRRRDAADVRIDIEQALAEPAAGAVPLPRGEGALKRRVRAAWFAATLATATAVALAIPYFRVAPPGSPETRTEIVTPATADPISFALSPDGRWVAYMSSESARAEIYIRPLAAPAAPIATGQAASEQWQVSTAGGIYPLWLPDGEEPYSWVRMAR